MSGTSGPVRAAEADAAVRTWLIDTARRLAEEFDGPIDDDTPLADGGLCLDSVRLLELLSAVEDHAGLVISDDEITEANLGTIGRVLRFIAQRRAGSAPGACDGRAQEPNRGW